MDNRTKWQKFKNDLLVMIDRERRSPSGNLLIRLFAKTVWSLHQFRQTLAYTPRYLRITLYHHGLLPAQKFHDSGDQIPFPNAAPNLSAQDQLAVWEEYKKEDQLTSKGRDLATTAIARINNSIQPRKFPLSDQDPTLQRLRHDGLVELPELTLSPATVARIVDDLNRRPVYAAHVPLFSDGVPRDPQSAEARRSPFGSYLMKDIVECPELLELALHPKALALAESYLGCAPSIYSLHAWWSFPGPGSAGPQHFHRDIDDYRFLALFVFLTDVKGGEEGGEHEYALTSHRLETLTETFGGKAKMAGEFFYPHYKGSTDGERCQLERLFADKLKLVKGKAGSVFMADVYGIHRGVPPTTQPRLVCWLRYGLRRNCTYTQATEPVPFDWNRGRIPNDDYTKFVTRLVLRR